MTTTTRASRALVALLVTLAAVLLAAGCGSSSDSSSSTSNSGGSQKTIKVGFVYSGPSNDGGFSEAADRGRKDLERQLSGKVTTIFKENVPESQQSVQVMQSMISQGAKVIFAQSYGYHPYTTALAKQHPDVKFFQFQSTETAPNLSEYNAALEEPYYLAGMAAGAASKSGHIGMVASFKVPPILNDVNGFALGARAVNPKATVNLVLINTFFDPSKEASAARSLADTNVDVLANNMDSPAVGQVAESRGIPFVGAFLPQQNFAPKQYITGALFDWAPFYVSQVRSVMGGSFKSGVHYLTTKDGAVKLDSFGPLGVKLVPKSVRDKIAKRAQELKAGKFNVYTGPISDNTGKMRVPAGSAMPIGKRPSIDWLVSNVKIG